MPRDGRRRSGRPCCAPWRVISAVTLLALGYLWLIDGVWDRTDDGMALAGFAVGTLLAALGAYTVRKTRLQRLREQRVTLAQRAIHEVALQRDATDGLLRLVDLVLAQLADWSAMLAEAKGRAACALDAADHARCAAAGCAAQLPLRTASE